MKRQELLEIFEPMLDPHPPELRKLCTEAVWRLAERLHPADCLMYDNYNFVVAGFTFTGKPGAAFLSLAVASDHASICFLQGVHLSDPEKRLKGGGNLVRNVRLESMKTLDDPYISELIDQAVAFAKKGECSGRAVLQSVSAKKRRPVPKSHSSSR